LKNNKRSFYRKVSIVTLLLFAMVMIMPMGALAAGTFNDTAGHWAEDQINTAVEKGYASGYPDGSFKPDQNISLAEFMVLVNKVFGLTQTTEISFSDVEAGAWYEEAVGIAKASGYISGYPDGTMRPDDPITREEAASIIMRLKNLTTEGSAADQFSDAEIMTWSKGAIGAVAEAGIMKGYPDNSFKPQNYITRAEAIVALITAFNYTIPSLETPAPDVKANNTKDTVTGLTSAMEYQLDDGEWVPYDADEFAKLDLSGNHTLLVRFAADGDIPASPATKLSFTRAYSDSSSKVAVKGISVDPEELTLTVGDTAKITATIEPGKASNKKVTWSSSTEDVATVDADGVVTAVADGTATITVKTKDSGFEATCEVTVEKTFQEQVESAIDYQYNPEYLYNGRLAPDGPYWVWSYTEINVVQAVNDIDRYLGALYRQDGSTIDSIRFEGIDYFWNDTGSREGSNWENNGTNLINTLELDITSNPENWPIRLNSLTLNNRDKGLNLNFNLVVESVPVTGVTLDQSTLTLIASGSETLVATVSPTEATNKKVTWNSSNDSIATVDATGKITAVAVGTATITVTTEDGLKTATCDVTVNK